MTQKRFSQIDGLRADPCEWAGCLKQGCNQFTAAPMMKCLCPGLPEMGFIHGYEYSTIHVPGYGDGISFPFKSIIDCELCSQPKAVQTKCTQYLLKKKGKAGCCRQATTRLPGSPTTPQSIEKLLHPNHFITWREDGQVTHLSPEIKYARNPTAASFW